MAEVRNPVFPGFFPDPSIVRVGADFYIVNSSFEYFPAIPVWHSRDLAHWRQIGNVVDRPEQGLDLSDVRPSAGVQAATIRHHNGTFYVTSTRIKREWPRMDYHFIVTATDPRGPWSKCHFIDGAEGIDSSLFFDDDGRAYFLANRQRAGSTDGNDTEIWASEIDLDRFQLIGPKVPLWAGTGGIYPEGPRLFKREGTYHLLIAEGGTLHNHATTFARSSRVFGPYEGSPRNPVLTHRHLAREHPIHNVGHADMVELADGTWWGACLGSRPRGGFYDGGNTVWSFGGYYRNLGRETFLFPVSWPADSQSPLFSPVTGKVEFTYAAPELPPHPQPDVQLDFSEESLRIKWLTLGDEHQRQVESPGVSRLCLRLQPTVEQSFIGVRQDSWNFKASVRIDASTLLADDWVGLSAYIKQGHFLVMRISPSTATIESSEGSQAPMSVPVTVKHLTLELSGNDQDYTFSIPELNVAHTLDGREISCDMTDSHTGVLIALLGQSEHGTSVDLRDFRYDRLPGAEPS